MASTDIEFMTELIALGKDLAYTGADLQKFVNDRLQASTLEKEKERELEEKKLQAEEKKRQSEERKVDKQIAADAQKRKDTIEAEEKCRLDEAERERRAIDRDLEKARIEAGLEEKRIELQHEEKTADLTNSTMRTEYKGRKHQKLDSFDPKKDDLDAYLIRFEAYATNCEWPKESWAMNLGLSLKGDALTVYSAQSPEHRQVYETSKAALMKAYHLTEEGFRKKFLVCKPTGTDTWQTYQSRITNFLTRWISLSGIEKTFDSLYDLLLREQIISVFQEDLRIFIRERNPSSVEEVIRVAESFREARGCTAVELCVFDYLKSKSSTNSYRKFRNDPTGKTWKFKSDKVEKKPESTAGAGLFNPGKPDSKSSRTSKSKFQPEKPYQDPAKPSKGKPGNGSSGSSHARRCFNCFSKEHMLKDCPKPLKAALALDEESSEEEEVQHEQDSDNSDEESAGITIPTPTNSEGIVTDVCTAAAVRQLKEYPAKVNGTDCKTIRDTGLTSMVVRESLVKPGQYTGKTIKCRLMDNSIVHAPEVLIEVESTFYQGKARAMAMRNPICDLAIGNIANVMDFDQKNLITVSPKMEKEMTKKPTSTKKKKEKETSTKKVEKIEESSMSTKRKVEKEKEDRKSPKLASVAVDTSDLLYETSALSSEKNSSNAQASSNEGIDASNKTSNTEDSSTDVETEDSAKDEIDQPELSQAVVTRHQQKLAQKPPKPLKVPAQIHKLSPVQFKREQTQDPSLREWWNFAKEEKRFSSKTGTVTWEVREGLLYRVFTEPKQLERTFFQLAVPCSQRLNILKISHDTVFGGHLGVRKTSQKVKTQFCWPGIDKSVRLYIRSCDKCQKFEPKGRTPRAHLTPMPITDQPFRKIAVDLVGPLKPMTERGHQYILTIMDYATRYPEAIALKKIDTETVAEALLDVYSRLGIPEEILSDLGTQFVSEVMNEVSRLLSIRRLTTSAYHAMGNGMVEKFNGTLKSMLKKLCKERPRDWDRYLSPVLFAYREAPHCTGGFSPFDMLYGWPVRGLLETVKDLWSDTIKEPEVRTSYKYVLDLRERLTNTCNFVKQNVKTAQEKYKLHYDKKAKVRSLQVGDHVLLLLPTDTSKLLMTWKGPYKIVKKIGELDYKVDMDGRLQTFHINMLKKYLARTPDVLSQIMKKPIFQPDSEQGCSLVAIESVVGATCLGVIEDPNDAIPTANSTKETLKDIDICPDLLEHVKDEQVKELWSILCKNKSMFSDVPSTTTLMTHDIKLHSSTPFRKKQYPVPFSLVNKVKDEVRAMLKMGVIEPSNSPYSSPYLMVKKPDDSTRFCVDLRALNSLTEFDAEPMPDVELMFTRFKGCKFFSELDMTKGYWQIPMTDSAKPYTAFATPLGHFQFKVMPFGCQGGPSSFSRLMRRALGEIEGCQNFLDNIVIATKTWEEHLETLEIVLKRLRKANLRLRPSKCHVGFGEIQCLGYMVDGENLWPIESKIEPVEKIQPPKTKKLMKKFLGFTGFYQKFIPRYSDLTGPLSDKTRKNFPNEIRWNEKDHECFEELKSALMKKPILVLPDFLEDFYLGTDASGTAIGAVLMQRHDDILKPVAYASKKLLDAERRYSTIERECLAIVWAISKFCRYLYGRRFVVLTDHKPLQFLKTSKQVNSRLMRWSLALQPYDFEIRAIKGADNFGPDFLSRMYEEDP